MPELVELLLLLTLFVLLLGLLVHPSTLRRYQIRRLVNLVQLILYHLYHACLFLLGWLFALDLHAFSCLSDRWCRQVELFQGVE